jgi:putative addiction module component (TIGR02574 family)
MIQAVPNPPPGFDDLTLNEKLDYIQSLWNRVAANPRDVSVPDWHLALIEERLCASPEQSSSGRPWNEVRDDLRARLGNSKTSR